MRHFHFRLLLFMMCLLVGSLQSCKNNSDTQKTITVSILPQKYFVEKIAGDYLQVNVMIPPGMSPETSDLNMKQLQKLHDSKLCFVIGCLPFEITHLFPVLEKHKDIHVINHTEGIDLLKGSCHHQHDHLHTGVDPHIWALPEYGRHMAENIYNALVKEFPEAKERFTQGYQSLLSEITTIQNKADEILSHKRGCSFLIYHPALTYLAEKYHLHQISIEQEGKEPNPSYLKDVINRAKDENIKIIFIQSQFDINNAHAIAHEIDAKIVTIDPLAENWTQEMNRILDILNETL